MSTVVRKLKGGYDYQKEEADAVGLVPGTEAKVIGGEINGYSSYYLLEGYEGRFNTVMFSGSFEDHEHSMDNQCSTPSIAEVREVLSIIREFQEGQDLTQEQANSLDLTAKQQPSKIKGKQLPNREDRLYLPQGSVDKDDLINTFNSNSNCYADTSDQSVVMAMTLESFIPLVNELLGRNRCTDENGHLQYVDPWVNTLPDGWDFS